MLDLPKLGKLLGRGSFAEVYEVEGNPSIVLKKTNCSATKVFLNKMRLKPVPGMPLVHKFLGDEGQWSFYLMERLDVVSLNDPDVVEVLKVMEGAQADLAFSIFEGYDDSEVSEYCARKLAERGYGKIAKAFDWLAYALTDLIDGGLDIRLPNLMRNSANELILSDPVREY